LFTHYGANVVVSKESGYTGGTDTKISAAGELGIPLVLIRRPALSYPLLARRAEEVIPLLTKNGVNSFSKLNLGASGGDSTSPEVWKRNSTL
ncbi:MAG: precorrin-6A/cobalt-precorrin-6A reductase, partial [Bacillota bacterium]